jgi:hypothetical protein
MIDLVIPKGLAHVSLPATGGPFFVGPLQSENVVRVYDRHRLLATLRNEERAQFVKEPPRWWRFWREPRWVKMKEPVR